MAGCEVGQGLACSGGSLDQAAASLIERMGNEFSHLGLLFAGLTGLTHQRAACLEHLGNGIRSEWSSWWSRLLGFGKRHDVC